MSFDVDAQIDRRRLKRRVAFWRFSAVIIFLVLLLALGLRNGHLFIGPHVARLALNGEIGSNPPELPLLDKIAKDASVKALILQIDSPGGVVTGSEELYHAIRRVAARKPVVAVIGSLGASGAYIAALGTDRIIARETSLTGSIGAFIQSPDFSGLMDKVGVKMNQVASGPLKGQPNQYEPMSNDARKLLQDLIDDGYDWFTGLVAERRNLPLDQVKMLADGRPYTGREAVDNKLIDALGGEREARAWLASEKKISESLPVMDVAVDRPKALIDRLLSSVLGKTLLPERLTLDGLVALWHP
jgi:protease-4